MTTPDHKDKRRRLEAENNTATSSSVSGHAEEEEGAEKFDEASSERIVKGGGHPLGVRPWGTLLMSDGPSSSGTTTGTSYESALRKRSEGLGAFSRFEDQSLLVLLGMFDAEVLSLLACTSKTFHCYASHEELWRALTFDSFRTGKTTFRGTWKSTYWKNVRGIEKVDRNQPYCTVYSDLLYQSWYCSNLEIPEQWLAVENVPRCSKLSHEEFQTRFEKPNLPVIVTDVVTEWPAFHKCKSRAYVSENFGKDQLVHVGGYEFTMPQYYEYVDRTNDEMPLYLFDKHFASKSVSLADDYSVPEYFSEDLFQVLGAERPDFRWLIIGPAKSGSTFHKDPNCTSAWNAVITGKKKWILFPPHITPPGVHASEDELHVATSVSLIEWFLNFYDAAASGEAAKCQPRECVVQAGEVIFVPRGWWHLVMNVEESVAITQNYVSRNNIRQVLRYIKNPELVSGCPIEQRVTLYERFYEKLREERPKLVERLEREEDDIAKRKKTGLAKLFENGSEKKDAGFKFNFL